MRSARHEARTFYRDRCRKTDMCRYFMTDAGCNKGAACAFAHGGGELCGKPDLKKTALCKRWWNGYCTQSTADCPFAHGEADLQDGLMGVAVASASSDAFGGRDYSENSSDFAACLTPPGSISLRSMVAHSGALAVETRHVYTIPVGAERGAAEDEGRSFVRPRLNLVAMCACGFPMAGHWTFCPQCGRACGEIAGLVRGSVTPTTWSLSQGGSPRSISSGSSAVPTHLVFSFPPMQNPFALRQEHDSQELEKCLREAMPDVYED